MDIKDYTGQRKPADYVYTGEIYNDNPQPDTTLQMNPGVYAQLTERIRQIKLSQKPLLIKINSHPCAGKSFFIEEHNGGYNECELIDFDTYKNEDRTSKSLLRATHHTALFGTAIYYDRWEAIGANEKEKFDGES